MKNKTKNVNVYSVEVKGVKYKIEMVKVERRNYNPNFIQFKCMVWEHGIAFEEQLTPHKRFDIIFADSSYQPWTGDCIRDFDREFRHMIADLFNNGELRITA